MEMLRERERERGGIFYVYGVYSYGCVRVWEMFILRLLVEGCRWEVGGLGI